MPENLFLPCSALDSDRNGVLRQLLLENEEQDNGGDHREHDGTHHGVRVHGLLGTEHEQTIHWMLADKNQSLVLEQTKTGLSLHRNDVGVLTNNPHFDVHMYHLSNYMSVSCEEPENKFSSKIHLEAHSRGMGGLGLPGDLSSMSRFVKASFTKLNSDFGQTEQEAVHQFFHVLYSVYQQKGCVKVGDAFEITNYSSCCNTCKGIYYYTTYYNSTIRAVDMFKENLDDAKLICYDMAQNDVFCLQN